MPLTGISTDPHRPTRKDRPRSFFGFMAIALLFTLAATATHAAGAPAAKLIGIIAAEKPPSMFVTVTADAWREAFEKSDLVRKQGLAVELLRTPQALAEAATKRAPEFFAIVNPDGEAFLCAGPDDAAPMLGRIRAYVGQGGIWWETGGWPLCHPYWPKAGGGWETSGSGTQSAEFFRLEAQDWKDDAPAVNPTVTDSGREWLGPAVADAIVTEKVTTQRGSSFGCSSVVLAKTGNAAYLSGHRAGYGWLFKVGGFTPSPKLIVPSAIAVCQHLWTMVGEVANPLPGSAAKKPHPPYRIGIVSPEPPQGAPFAIDPNDLREALQETSLVRCAYLGIVPLRTPAELNQALTERAGDYFAIINPLGESFMVGDEADAKPMLARIKGYLEQGGMWWDVTGIPFWYPCWPKRENGNIVGWTGGSFGPDGLATFGGKAEITADVEPALLQVTPAGREMLGPAWADLLSHERGDANRWVPAKSAAVILAQIRDRPYLSASRVGKGLLWQTGGVPVGAPVAFPAIMGTLKYLWTHPMP